MQDLRAMGSGGGGRIFGGDRRLRPHTNQALKCPRCDSLNTKFCYYNNYNLSQPRHFCKSCRRYWTKGGVLRNVPVGGGCRKTKRSKAKPSTEVQKEKKSSSHSSSESSNLTATTTTTGTATDAVSVASSSSAAAAAAVMPNFHDSRFFFSQNPIPNFEPSMMETLDQTSDGGIFAETGTFTSLMTAVNPNPTFLGFNFSDFSPVRLHHQQQQQQTQQQKMSSMVEELKLQELTAASFLDQTVPVELPGLQGRATTCNGGINALEWQNCGDQQGLFDLGSSNGVEQGYWSHNQWNESENDHSLYLP